MPDARLFCGQLSIPQAVKRLCVGGVEWSQISQINVRAAPFGFLLPFPRPTTKFIAHIDVRFLAFLANYTNVPLLEILPA
jgi:hypothetical protein